MVEVVRPIKPTGPALAPANLVVEAVCTEVGKTTGTVQIKEEAGLHTCAREIHHYRFSIGLPLLGEYPYGEVTIVSLEPLPFEQRRKYQLQLKKD